MKQPEQKSYLQSVTDSLCGHTQQVCAAGQVTREAETEADRLRRVWGILDILSPPEPDAAQLERIYRQVVTRTASEEIDDDELDRAVGAAKPPEIKPDDFKKDT